MPPKESTGGAAHCRQLVKPWRCGVAFGVGESRILHFEMCLNALCGLRGFLASVVVVFGGRRGGFLGLCYIILG